MLKEVCLSHVRYGHFDNVIEVHGNAHDHLGPAKVLFNAFYGRKKELEKALGKGSAEAHNQAWLEVNFEDRFIAQMLDDVDALVELEKISEQSKSKDIHLACYEGNAKACHRRILLRLCETAFDAEIEVQGVEPKN